MTGVRSRNGTRNELYLMRMTNEDGKLFFYRWDSPTQESKRIPLVDADDMRRVIDRAIKMRETITIVDEEDLLIFRSERGIVCWPRIGVHGVAA